MGRSIWTEKGPDKDEIILVCSLVDLEQNKNERLFKVTFASALFACLALSGTVTPVTVRVRFSTASCLGCGSDWLVSYELQIRDDLLWIWRFATLTDSSVDSIKDALELYRRARCHSPQSRVRICCVSKA